MVGLHFSDPEAKAELESRKRLRDLEFLKDQIGEDTYVLSLTFCGYSKKDAQTEASLLKMDSRFKRRA